jgi:hypothetical protein
MNFLETMVHVIGLSLALVLIWGHIGYRYIKEIIKKRNDRNS